MVKNLIFVEGVSGVGKSTLTKKLCDRLREMGFSSECYLEFDSSNPIDFYCTAYFKQDEYAALLREYPEFVGKIESKTFSAKDVRLIRYYDGKTALFPEPLLGLLRRHEFCYNPVSLIPLSEYTRLYQLIWEKFAQDPGALPDYLFFDGSLFHHPINDMMRNYHVSSEQAFGHIGTLIETVGAFRSQVVYLSSDDIAGRLQKARTSRMETPPTEKQIQFWGERKQMDMAVIQRLPIPCTVCDVSQENWDSQIDAVVLLVLGTDGKSQAGSVR